MQHISDDVADAATRLAGDLRSSCVGVRVGRLSRLVGRRYEAALRPLGLSVAQLEVLGALTLAGEPARPAQLSAWLAVERSTMSRNLALMERRGYVVTTDTSPTGRSQRVTISDEGRTALARADQVWGRVQHDVLAEVGPDAVATLDRWLAALTSSDPGEDADPV